MLPTTLQTAIRLAIAILGTVIDVHVQARELLDHELADEPGVPGRAAGKNRYAIDRAQRLVADLHFFEEHLARVLRHTPEDGLARRRRLLEDFLEHEVL